MSAQSSKGASGVPGTCPLGEGAYWYNSVNYDGVPDYCKQRCGEYMTSAAPNTVRTGSYVVLSALQEEAVAECDHDLWALVDADRSLQRDVGAQRVLTIFDKCEGCDEEQGLQDYYFICPHDA